MARATAPNGRVRLLRRPGRSHSDRDTASASDCDFAGPTRLGVRISDSDPAVTGGHGDSDSGRPGGPARRDGVVTSPGYLILETPAQRRRPQRPSDSDRARPCGPGPGGPGDSDSRPRDPCAAGPSADSAISSARPPRPSRAGSERKFPVFKSSLACSGCTIILGGASRRSRSTGNSDSEFNLT